MDKERGRERELVDEWTTGRNKNRQIKSKTHHKFWPSNFYLVVGLDDMDLVIWPWEAG